MPATRVYLKFSMHRKRSRESICIPVCAGEQCPHSACTVPGKVAQGRHGCIVPGADSRALSENRHGGDSALDRGALDGTGHLMSWSGEMVRNALSRGVGARARRTPTRGVLILERGGDPLEGYLTLERGGGSPAWRPTLERSGSLLEGDWSVHVATHKGRWAVAGRVFWEVCFDDFYYFRKG
jgi:hypothetical protein